MVFHCRSYSEILLLQTRLPVAGVAIALSLAMRHMAVHTEVVICVWSGVRYWALC
jgi:hypothetical protein